jgi:hypothetical protein
MLTIVNSNCGKLKSLENLFLNNYASDLKWLAGHNFLFAASHGNTAVICISTGAVRLI